MTVIPKKQLLHILNKVEKKKMVFYQKLIINEQKGLITKEERVKQQACHSQRIYDDIHVRKRIQEDKINVASAYYNIRETEEYKKIILNVQKLFAEKL